MSKKLTDKELESIQLSQNKFTKAKIAIADVELQKAAILKNIDEIKTEFAATEKELIEKYGKDSSINMQTGEVKTLEETNAEEKEQKKQLEKVE